MTAADKIAEALLPCPFCGSQTRISGFSKRIEKVTPTLIQTAQVKCKRPSCGMSGPLVKGDNCRRMAVAAFNVVVRRADLADALAQENARLQAENADLKTSVIAFGGVHAVTYAKQFGLPDGQLHPTHYDILEKAGARMDDFTRAALGETP